MRQAAPKVFIILMAMAAQCCGSNSFEPRPRGQEEQLLNQISENLMVVLRIRKTLIQDKINRAKKGQLNFNSQSVSRINEELMQSCDALHTKIYFDLEAVMHEIKEMAQKDWFKE